MLIAASRVGLEWPNGQTVFENLNFSLYNKIYALVGVNGVGKSTLAELIAGARQPTSGRISRSGSVAFFRQNESPPSVTVAEYLDHSEMSWPADHMRLCEGAWLGRPCAELSGGEWTRVRLARVLRDSPDLLILDEPTNHLDAVGRQAIGDVIENFAGGVLLISHDRDLLSRAEEVWELKPDGLSITSGPYAIFEKARLAERERRQDILDRAKREREQAAQKRTELLHRQERRQARGRRTAEKRALPKILRGAAQTRGRSNCRRGGREHPGAA